MFNRVPTVNGFEISMKQPLTADFRKLSRTTHAVREFSQIDGRHNSEARYFAPAVESRV